MASRRRVLTHLGAVAAVTAAGVVPRRARGDEIPGAQRVPWPAAQPTPELDLPRLDGPPWRLADAMGQVVLLNFWASWCEPCRAELPSLQRLARRHANDGLQVLAANFKEHERTVRRFVEAQALELTVLRDADGEAARAWGARLFPTTVLVGRDGRAAFSVRGEVDWENPRALLWIRPLLRGRKT